MTSYDLTQALIAQAGPSERLLWVNPPDIIGSTGTMVVQSMKPAHDRYDIETVPCLERVQGQFDRIIMFPPRNRQQQQGWIAQCSKMLSSGGTLNTAQDNTAGSRSLQKDVENCFNTVLAETKHKGRLITASDPKPPHSLWLSQGNWQSIMDGNTLSRPGLFAWDRLDRGSSLLIDALPTTFRGLVADFGCGWGALTRHLLDISPDVETVFAIDADWMAVEAARRNATDPRARFIWADCTQPINDLPPLDIIIMNPPFHDGSREDANDLGASMIANAAQSLNVGGMLWMVANSHLPYERILDQYFRQVILISEDQGFKIYAAKRS